MEERDSRGSFLKFLLTAAFLTGVGAYFYGFSCTDGFAAAGFALLAVFSVMCAWGIQMIDMTVTAYFRTTTKAAMFLFPFSVNFGAWISAWLIMEHMHTAALCAAAAACVIAVISSSLLVIRYREDDL
ncbi:MAG: hypothetical protein IJ368_04325 [Oscillospiraceae bacterium]|nr:hypothetical protein [Oscillospiraceae bacterium]